MRFTSRDLGRFVFTWAVNTAALGVAAWLIGQVSYDSFLALVGAGLVFGLVNTFLKPLLVVLGIPVIVLTLGIGLFLINMLMLWLTAVVVPGFDASGFWQLAKAAIVIWLTNLLLSGFWPDDDPRGRITTVWVRQG